MGSCSAKLCKVIHRGYAVLHGAIIGLRFVLRITHPLLLIGTCNSKLLPPAVASRRKCTDVWPRHVVTSLHQCGRLMHGVVASPHNRCGSTGRRVNGGPLAVLIPATSGA